MLRLPVILCLGLCVAATATSPATRPPGVVADFETSGGDVALKAANVKPSVASGAAAQGQRYLQLDLGDNAPGKSYVRIPLPAGLNPAEHTHFSAALRAPQSQQPVEARWLALDAKGRPILQRRATIAPGEGWVTLDEPLHGWRWESGRVGDWDEVRELAVRIDSAGARRVDVDDIRFAGPRPGDSEANGWLIGVAFDGRKVESAGGEGLLVATDATDAFGEPDLATLLEQMRAARGWVRRVFQGAVRPTEDLNSPAALLIFADDAHYRAFFGKFGDALRVTIEAPRSGGYTVQDVAASAYRKEVGPRRPVYLHESVHAVVARDLRLLTGHAPHRPLQEGIATYLQICVHPKSIDRGAYVSAFARGTGGGMFKPLAKLFNDPVTEREYAQLASVIGYLVERDADLLRALATALADGSTADQVLAQEGRTWDALERDWLAWGRARFAADDGANAVASFHLPEEFAKLPPAP